MTTNKVYEEEFTFGEFSSEDEQHKVEAILKVSKKSLDDNHKTYQLFLKPTQNVQNIYSIHAIEDETTPIKLPVSYNHNVNAVNEDVTPPNPLFHTPTKDIPEPPFPKSEYDSWLGFESIIPGQISSIGIDFADWNNSKTLTITDGAIFSMDPTSENKQNEEDEIMISQLTVDENQEIDITINIQGQSTITGVNLYQINDITFIYDPKEKLDDDEEYEFIKKIKDGWDDFKSFFENI